MLGVSFHPHYKLKQNRWFTNTGESWIIETPFSRFVKRAMKLSLDRMWRHFSLDDAYTKILGVFCPAPGPTPILGMARAYGLRPRLWLLTKIILNVSEKHDVKFLYWVSCCVDSLYEENLCWYFNVYSNVKSNPETNCWCQRLLAILSTEINILEHRQYRRRQLYLTRPLKLESLLQ